MTLLLSVNHQIGIRKGVQGRSIVEIGIERVKGDFIIEHGIKAFQKNLVT